MSKEPTFSQDGIHPDPSGADDIAIRAYVTALEVKNAKLREALAVVAAEMEPPLGYGQENYQRYERYKRRAAEYDKAVALIEEALKGGKE